MYVRQVYVPIAYGLNASALYQEFTTLLGEVKTSVHIRVFFW